jgi:phosphoribosyl 1,2-cyclic phosphodiesterase
MKFTPIASSSSGNCYYLTGDQGSVLIELGISWKKILPAIGFRASALDFALCTHSHGDHSAAAKDALKAGVDVGMSIETATALGVQDHHRFILLKAGEQKTIGSWTILPFDCVHDVPTLGFLIAQGAERLLFVPDTQLIGPRFSGLTSIAVECNYISDILTDNILRGSIPAVVGHRVRRSHMELSTVVNFLKANDLSNVRAIWLLHLSSGNSDEARMKLEVQQAVGIPCYIAA